MRELVQFIYIDGSIFNRATCYIDLSAALRYYSGKTLGKLMVDKGLIKSLDDLVTFGIDFKIGLIDLYKESDNKSRVHVYECITCSGIPNIGKTVCYYEGGVIAGVIERLTNSKVRVVETHCWGTGIYILRFRCHR